MSDLELDPVALRERHEVSERILAAMWPPFEQPQVAVDGIDPAVEEDYLTAVLPWPGRASHLRVRPMDLWTERLRWILEGMLAQTNPGPSYDIDLIARHLQRHGFTYALAVAEIAKVWAREPGIPEALAEVVMLNAFRRHCIRAACNLAKATTKQEARAAVVGVV